MFRVVYWFWYTNKIVADPSRLRLCFWAMMSEIVLFWVRVSFASYILPTSIFGLDCFLRSIQLLVWFQVSMQLATILRFPMALRRTLNSYSHLESTMLDLNICLMVQYLYDNMISTYWVSMRGNIAIWAIGCVDMFLVWSFSRIVSRVHRNLPCMSHHSVPIWVGQIESPCLSYHHIHVIRRRFC